MKLSRQALIALGIACREAAHVANGDVLGVDPVFRGRLGEIRKASVSVEQK